VSLPPRRRPRAGSRPGPDTSQRSSPRVASLADLGSLRDTIQRQAREAAERTARELAAQRAQARQQQAHHDLFARTVGPVHRLPERHLAEIDLPRPPPTRANVSWTRLRRWPNRCRTRSRWKACC